MKAVILAAGEGTRLRPLTNDRPKPLVRVAGKPILNYCFERVVEAGIREAIVVVGYKREQIIDYYGESFGDLQLTYAHQETRDGLAHAVLAAKQYIDSNFVILNGDNIYRMDLTNITETYATTDADVVFPIEKVSEDAAQRGAVCVMEGESVTRLIEKPEDPPSHHVAVPVYCVSSHIFHACELVRPSPRGEYELPDAINLLLHAGYSAQTVPFDGERMNINDQSDIEQAEAWFKEKPD